MHLGPLQSDLDGMAVSAALRDISHQKRMEAVARGLAGRVASAVDYIPDGLAIFDDNDRLVLCNRIYRRLIGRVLAGPVVGRTYEEILDSWLCQLRFKDDKERRRFRAARLPLHEHLTTFDARTQNGRSLRTTHRRTPEGGTVETIWDLTDEVNLFEKLREARGAAEASNNAKNEFLSSISHELRTPLNAILGFAQLLQWDKKEPLSDRHRERIDHIVTGGEHLLRVINDILDLSRIEARAVSISTEPLDVREVLEEVATTLYPIAVRQGIRIEVESLPSETPMVAADRTRFVQILMNFGSNAIKYNRPAGKVTFSVSASRTGHVRITVRDTGVGIPPDKQDKVFQPFQRAGQETGPIEGTGIGLAITKRLAQLMRGDVGFFSVLGKGSAFWAELPVHESGTRLRALPARTGPAQCGPIRGNS